MTAEAGFRAWLLGAATPSIRYRTLTGLLGLPVGDARVRAARRAIMSGGPVPAILARQTKSGRWLGEHSFYTPKYVSTHWSMMLLAELDVEPDDPRFGKGVEYMLAATSEQRSKSRYALQGPGWSCFWGNLLRYAITAGFAEDARVGEIIRYACEDLEVGPCRCRANGGNPCAWGAVRTLWGLAAIPKEKRTGAEEGAIAQGLRFLLSSFNLLEADYPSSDRGRVSPLWFKLSFPLFYQVDILFTLRVLGELEALDHPGARAALDWLEGRRGRDGRWHGTSPFRSRTWRQLGDREETDRWVSLHAARALQQAGRSPVLGAEA